MKFKVIPDLEIKIRLGRGKAQQVYNNQAAHCPPVCCRSVRRMALHLGLHRSTQIDLLQTVGLGQTLGRQQVLGSLAPLYSNAVVLNG